MTLFLHIGTHKTGTTAIQRFAERNRDALRERGLWYPSFEEIGRRKHYGHHHFAHAIAGRPRNPLSFDDALAFNRAIQERRRQDEDVLLSAEPIYRHVLSTGGDYWSQRDAYVRKLRQVVDADDVVILIVLRRQDHFALSLFQELVKVTRYPKSFREFINTEKHYFEYNKHIEIFRNSFKSIRLLVFEDLRQNGLVRSFFQGIGVDISGISEPTVRNKSLPTELVEYKRLLNQTKAEQLTLKNIGEKLLEWSEKNPQNDLSNAIWIERSEMKAFYAQYAGKNERLRLEFARDHPAPLFPAIEFDSSTGEREVYRGMTVDRFAHLTANIFL